jgi:hypothetical protein
MTDDEQADQAFDLLWDAFEAWPEDVNLGDHCRQHVSEMTREALELIAADLLVSWIAETDDELTEAAEEEECETCSQIDEGLVIVPPERPTLLN